MFQSSARKFIVILYNIVRFLKVLFSVMDNVSNRWFISFNFGLPEMCLGKKFVLLQGDVFVIK